MLNNKMEKREEKSSEVKDQTIEISKSEQQRENRLKTWTDPGECIRL